MTRVGAVLVSLLVSVTCQQLQLVQVVFRHGDRSPGDVYPTDVNLDAWPEGYHQLTNLGKSQSLSYGRWLRNRYSDFLNVDYNADDVYVRSSDVDRTLQTAECVLAGLYPPQGQQVWDPDLPWQPIPIHAVPEDSDLVLQADDACARYDQALDEYIATPEIQSITDSLQELFRTISLGSGENITTIMDASSLADILLCESIHGLDIPSWAQDLWPSIMHFKDLKYQIKTGTEELKILQAGAIIGEIRNNLQKKVNGDTPKLQLYLYSAHDSTVGGLSDSLGIFNEMAPPYLSTVLLELWQDDSQQSVIKTYFRNETDSEDVLPMNLPFCEDPCSLESFISGTENKIFVDPVAQCSLK